MDIQCNDESKIPHSYFGSTLNKSIPRVSYLRSIFGITGEYCHAFRFDGSDFWIPNQISYKKVKRLQCDSFDLFPVDTNKYRIPSEICNTVYDYSCLDGSPDMRYSNNCSHTYTYRFLISFHCDDDSFKIYTFASSQHIVNFAIDKFNVMLSVKSNIDIEAQFASYLRLFCKSEELIKATNECDERKKELERIVKPLSALPADSTIPSINKDHIVSELVSTNTKLMKLNKDIDQTKKELFGMTQEFRNVIELHYRGIG